MNYWLIVWVMCGVVGLAAGYVCRILRSRIEFKILPVFCKYRCVSGPGYSTLLKLKYISRSDALDMVANTSADSRIDKMEDLPFIASMVGYNKWVMYLDCDSESNMLAAVKALSVYDIDCAVIESNSKRYWIITDFISDIHTVLFKMTSIPGVDRDWLDSSIESKSLVIRATPKHGALPTFNGTGTLKSEESIRLYSALEEHFTSERMRKIAKIDRLACGIKDGNVANVLADPDF